MSGIKKGADPDIFFADRIQRRIELVKEGLLIGEKDFRKYPPSAGPIFHVRQGD